MKMDWGAFLIALCGVIYAATSVAFGATGRPWLAVAYLGYVIGNVGLFMVALGHR